MSKTYPTILNLPKVDFALLILRVGISALMLTHGIPKVIDLFNGGGVHFGDPIGIGAEASLALATIAEFICSILLILGLGTRVAAVVLLINMFVAVFFALGAKSLLDFIPKQFALLFLICYLFLFYTGGGKFSLDQHFIRKKALKDR